MSSAFICGCAATVLTSDEQALFADARPWGLILFQRNIASPQQVQALVAAFRAAVGDDDAPVLVDQEGGRVQRLGPPFWQSYPPARSFGAVYQGDKLAGLNAARQVARLIADDLHALGITVNCLPVLDVPQAGSHPVIGDRAYADQPESVALLAQAAIAGLMDGGVLPVIKHVPGHGRAMSDSHHELPVVTASLAELRAGDFVPFAAHAGAPMAMTAHIVYRSIDPKTPATLSRRVLGMVRDEIGFDGLIMTDDLSMKALTGSIGERASRALKAGCDMLLHCNGNFAEMVQVAEAAGPLAGQALLRADRARRSRRAPQPFDRDQALITMNQLMGEPA
jgi:beta-N-acetylhexosaminidase